MAFISDLPSRAALEASVKHRELYLGIKTKAENMGYVVERFFVGPRQLTPARLGQVLESRNIHAVIIGAFTLNTTALPLNWDHLCGLKIESFHVQPELDVITADHCQAARLAIKNLRLLGYHRVGLALTRDEDARLENLFLIGYLVEHQHQLLKEEVAPFYFDDPESGTLPAQIENWIIRDRIDAVVSNTALLSGVIQRTRHPAARHVAFGSLDMAETDAEVAGIVMNYRMVGERAAELLAICMHTNQRGIPVNAATTTTPVGWSDGTSAPRIK